MDFIDLLFGGIIAADLLDEYERIEVENERYKDLIDMLEEKREELNEYLRNRQDY